MHVMTDRLVVGNIYDAERPPASVGSLLLVAGECSIVPPVGLDFELIPLKEHAQVDAVVLARAVNWLEQHVPANKTMICCRAGMGRSVSVAMAYLCCVERMAYDDALNLALIRRPGALPLPQLRSTIEMVDMIRRGATNACPPPAPG